MLRLIRKPSSPGKSGYTSRVFLAAFVSLWLLSAAQPPSSDAATIAAVARNVVLNGTVSMDYRSPGYTVTGRDGREYGKFPAGPSIVAVPGQILERLVSTAAMPRDRQDLFLRLVRGLTAAATGAGAVAALFAALRLLGCGLRRSLLVTLLFSATTFALPYLRSAWSESFQMLAVNLSILGAARFLKKPDLRGATLFGFTAGLLFPAKMVLGIFALPLAAGVLCSSWKSVRDRPALLAAAVAGALPPVAVWIGYDVIRFGELLLSGGNYGYFAVPVNFGNPIAAGLYGLLLSSGRGMIWFAPAAILSFIGIALIVRHRTLRDPMKIGIAAGVLATTLLYAAFSVWHGGEQWGPRFLAPMLGPLAVLSIPAFYRLGRRPGIVIALIATAGLAVNIPAVLVSPADFYSKAPYTPYSEIRLDKLGTPQEKPEQDNLFRFNFVPAFSPVLGHWWLAGHAFSGSTEWSDAPWRGSIGSGPAVRNKDIPVAIDLWFVRGNDWSRETTLIACIIAALLALAAAGAWFELVGLARKRPRGDGLDGAVAS